MDRPTNRSRRNTVSPPPPRTCTGATPPHTKHTDAVPPLRQVAAEEDAEAVDDVVAARDPLPVPEQEPRHRGGAPLAHNRLLAQAEVAADRVLLAQRARTPAGRRTRPLCKQTIKNGTYRPKKPGTDFRICA
eukprot:gene3002-biopygen15697